MPSLASPNDAAIYSGATKMRTGFSPTSHIGMNRRAAVRPVPFLTHKRPRERLRIPQSKPILTKTKPNQI